MLYGDPLLGPALLALPLRLLGANPVLLYNGALLLSLILASLGFHRLALELGAGRAAWLAGIAIPYTGAQTARLFHLNLLAIPFFPFLMLGLLRLLEAPRLAVALGTGLAFALQAGTSGYHAFSCVLVSLVFAAWGWRRLRRPRTWACLALAGAVAALVLLPYVTGFLHIKAQEARMERDPAVPAAASLDLLGLAGSHAYLWRHVLPGGAPFFPGLAVLILAGFALRDLRRDTRVRLLVAVALASWLMALGPEVRCAGRTLGPGPFALLVKVVPLLDAMRHPSSFAVPGLMALGLLAALGLERSGLVRSRLAMALVLAAAFAETLAQGPARRLAPLERPAVYAYLETQPPGGVLELPFDDVAWTWWAAHHRLPIVNGVGAFEPRRYQALWQLFRREWRKAGARDLRESRALDFLQTWYPVRYVVVHAKAPEDMRRSAALSPGSLELLRETADGARVYRLLRGGTGPALARAFRDDQLRGARIVARLRGAAGAQVEALFAGAPLPPRATLSPQPADFAWDPPRARIARGLNLLELRALPEGAPAFELLDVEAR